MRRAAGVLIINNDGKVLAVSRGEDLNDFGLPCGKANPEETWEEAAARECFEETGLRVYGLKEIFTREDGEFVVKTFSVERYFGEIISSKEGKVEWKNIEDLVSNGSFANYNKNLFKHLGLI